MSSDPNGTRMDTSESMPTSPPAPERAVWQGTPSQLINFPQYVLWLIVLAVLIVLGVVGLRSMEQPSSAARWLLIVAALVPIVVIVWKWLVVATTQYELTTQRLRLRTGVLNKHLDELELYRVRDYKLEQPFFLRMFSLSVLRLTTSDRTHPIVVLRAIPRGEELREQMRTYVEESRQRRGVREIDLE